MTASLFSTWPQGTRRLRVGDLDVDLHCRRLVRPDEEVELTQRVFELLVLFLAEPNVLHSRADLFKRLWPDVVVEDANLSQSIWMLRKALGPERRQWIRTVAKSGYIFEPPGAVEVVPGAESPPAESSAPAGTGPDVASRARGDEPGEESETHAVAPPAGAPAADPIAGPVPDTAGMARSTGRSHWPGRFIVVGLAVALAMLVLTGITRLRQHWLPGNDQTISVALVEIDDEDAPAETRWPITLLRAWLGWKLAMLPDVTVLNEAHLATHTSEESPLIVMLAGGRVPGRPDLLYVRARLDGDAGGRQLEVRGTADEIPALVDTLSRQVMDVLLPGRKGQAWPDIGIDADIARRYADAYKAHHRRDFARSRRDLREIVADAPDFGLAQYQLSLALSGLGHASAAIHHMERAVADLQPLPADAAQVLEARRLGVDPARIEDATRAFVALAARYPGKRDFAFEEAWSLIATGRAAEALEILNRPGWDDIPVGPTILREQLLAQAHGILSNYDAATRHARIALRLAEEAGAAWQYEQATAKLHLAEIEYTQFPGRMDLGRFDEIANQFDAADAPADALYTRFLAESLRPGGEASERLDALLATARNDGYLSIEIEILRLAALQQRNQGDHAGYRKWLEQALATAHEAGDVVATQAIETDMLYETLMTGELDRARELIEQLRNTRLEGDMAHWINQTEAFLSYADGQYDKALGILDRDAHAAGEGKEGDGTEGEGLPAVSAARAACMRGRMQMAQGDLISARNSWARCSQPNFAITQLYALHGMALSDLLAGDREAALEKLDVAQARAMEDLPPGPDRLDFQVQVAALMVRAGELDAAHDLFEHLLPQLEGGGYDWLKAEVELGLAEIAAARGEWDASRNLAEQARLAAPKDTWVVEQRLDLLDVVLMLAAGDRGEAAELLTRMDEKAHRTGDAVAQLEAHSLMSRDANLKGCSPQTRSALLARTGLRGASLAWLTQSLTATDMEPGMSLQTSSR
ncbi:winged helix-turn-helix domain-containing protein [Marilutibacter spongiae]|uniref:Winged helix-turn-helix domain-containing protein n=1 Tax=Marilutibacter spongiae TaxID=2025720 RepID=A0A7W3TJQ4_9GAMM|nr:winged helix-turn-helix domain-containing protein [Lysobacter spongiae]